MEEHQENLTEPDSSMEELKIEEDDNIKEISLDDILGAQTLLMSDSDENSGDNCNDKNVKSPRKKIVPKQCNRLLDSDEELESENQIEASSEQKFMENKKKISVLIDSDSDVDQNNSEETEPTELTETHMEYDTKVKRNLKGDIKNAKSNDNLKKGAKKHENGLRKRSKIKEKSEKCSDSESTKYDVKITKNVLSLVDTDSSGTESGAEVVCDLGASAKEANFEENNDYSEKNKKPKIMRASAKKALDEMLAIQSEQQRLHREAHISIPYHKPRKHTLDEFLKRRTIIQPQNSSPVAAGIQTKSLKMTTEELEEYAKLMEDRAKEATEFFKSESENEEEEILKDNEGVLDKPTPTIDDNIANSSAQSLDLQNEIEKLKETEDQKSTSDELLENHDGVQLTEAELNEILAEKEMTEVEEEQQQSKSAKVLITEVIELPKLDMNTVKISPIRRYTPRSSLNVKQLLAEKVLSESPSLSGDPNKLIDLNTGNLIEKKPTGMENLVKRLMSTMKAKKVKNSEICNILSIENGKLEISKVNISRPEVKGPKKETKPGAAYFELKKNLKEIIKKKRLQEINKKQDDELEYNKCLADEDSEVEEEEEYEPEENIESNVILVDEEENALVVKNDNKTTGDDEYAENHTDDELEDRVDFEDKEIADESDSDDEESNENEENNDCIKSVDKSQRKSRIITAFVDSDEELADDDIDFLKTQGVTTQLPLFETQSSVKNSLDDENELMALCSGTFDITQKHSINALMSQIPITQNCGKALNDDELMELCSGKFDQADITQQQNEMENISDNLKTKCNKILSSDEENDEELINIDERNKQKVKKLTKKQKKKKVKLGFSDDEDEEEYGNEESFNEEDDIEEETNDNNFKNSAEEPETFIDYDSEENEILVQLTKNDKVKQAKNFVENEAELSESEWGSADEDENNLDKYDIELGDEDDFDKEKLRTELGKIHARKMLDEDIREVRKIQELLFEDEEKDGVGRQRTFKWKNAESGFSLEDGRRPDEEGDNQNGDSGDEINEHHWRKIRYEREQFLKEKGLKPCSQDTSTVLTNTSIPVNAVLAAVTTKKLQIITTKKTTISSSDTKKGSPFLISKGISTMHKKSVRGSFLVRDRDTLNKLVGLTKGTSSSTGISDLDDTASTVAIKSVRPTNFVFATLTEEEHENLKRKADDSLNSSNENGKDFMKKPKIEPRRDKCFIDQLL